MLRIFLLLIALPSALAVSGPCVDAVVTCPNLVNMGYCVSNVLVRGKCPVSCEGQCSSCVGLCAGPGPAPAPAPLAPAPGPAGPSPVGPGPAGPAPVVPAPAPAPGMCNAKGDCCDTVATCGGFKNAGACNKKTEAIKKICRHTCGFCSEVATCAKSQFDCYSEQMACAAEIRKAGLPLTAQALIECVKPEALKKPPTDCCRKWVDYTLHCAGALPAPCECDSYDVFHDPAQSCPVPGPVGPPAIQKFTVRFSQWSTKKACDQAIGGNGPSKKFKDSRTVEWALGCNEQAPKGSVHVECGKASGSIVYREFRSNDCTGGSPTPVAAAHLQCFSMKKVTQLANFLDNFPSDCGGLPTMSPTPGALFTDLKGWIAYCRDTAPNCKACGGKLKKNKKTGAKQCTVNKKSETKVKCKVLSEDICNLLGCKFNTKKGKCTNGSNKNKVAPAWTQG